MRVVDNGLSSLHISWTLGFIDGVPVSYTLTARKLTTSAEAIIISELQDQYYEFKYSTLCDSYSFIVEAVTAAGTSASAPYIFRARRDINDEICATTLTPKSKCFFILGH